ncbi:interferon regulatory factor 8-like [Biomphalaria glabrata]|uniref:Interferon regulatory factor 8-like n=1 Tax=Biomphalaria glabrata TaxID=6526 RepID=A0A9U8E2Q6_BIOGL|nr:interferon regulatory factor 8-like [Biomphalaria glabrata]
MSHEMTEDHKNLNMANWLAQQLATKACPGLKLIDGSGCIFRIPWCNEKSGGLRPGGDDTSFIIAWARHKEYSGTWENDKDLRHWKENFRNALNKCKNIEKVETLSVKNEYIVCRFTEKFYATLKPPIGQSRKRNLTGCSSSSSLSRDDDGMPMIKKSPSSVPPANVGGNLKLNGIPGQSSRSFNSSPSSQVTSLVQFPIFQSQSHPSNNVTECIQVDIMYGFRVKRCVTSAKLNNSMQFCRIGSFDIPELNETLSVENEIRIPFPRMEELAHHAFNETEKATINEIVSGVERGIILSHDVSGIFIQRRTPLYVFLTDGKSRSELLSREDDSNLELAFDISEFYKELGDYKNGTSRRSPKPWIILTIGQDIEGKRENPLEGCAVYIQIIHLQAQEILRNEQERIRETKPPLCSNQDKIDIMLSLLNDPNGADMIISLFGNQDNNKSLELNSLSDSSQSAFSEILSLQRENISLAKCQDSGVGNNVMSVEIYYSGCLVSRTEVPESASKCRIFFGSRETQLNEDNFLEDGSFGVRLPDVNVLDQYSVGDRIKKEIEQMLLDLTLGVHFMYNKQSTSIYSERRSVIRVFKTDNKKTIGKIDRRTNLVVPEPELVFDFLKFIKDLSQSSNGPNFPKPYAILTIGHEIEPVEENPLQNVLIYIKVTHNIADVLHQNAVAANDRHSSLKYSMPDSLDKTIKCLQELRLTEGFTKMNDVCRHLAS